MPLEFADFAHYYEGQGLSETQQLAHFEPWADLMECIARLYWRDNAKANALGITLDGDSLSSVGGLESDKPLQTTFNSAASQDAGGKKEP